MSLVNSFYIRPVYSHSSCDVNRPLDTKLPDGENMTSESSEFNPCSSIINLTGFQHNVYVSTYQNAYLSPC